MPSRSWNRADRDARVRRQALREAVAQRGGDRAFTLARLRREAAQLHPLLDPVIARAICVDPEDGLGLTPTRAAWRRAVERAIPDDHPAHRAAAMAVWAGRSRDRRWGLPERQVARTARVSKTTAHRALEAMHTAGCLWRSRPRYDPATVFRPGRRPRYRTGTVWPIAPTVADLPRDALFRATAFYRLAALGWSKRHARALCHQRDHAAIYRALRASARGDSGPRPAPAPRPAGDPVPLRQVLMGAADALYAAAHRALPPSTVPLPPWARRAPP